MPSLPKARMYLGKIGFGMRAMKREVIDGDETDMRFADARWV